MSHNYGGATNTNPASQSRTSRSKTHKLSTGDLGHVFCWNDEVVDLTNLLGQHN